MTEPPPAPAEVGVVGLGMMGGQMARHLLAAGYRVTGRDVEPDRAAEFTALGGTAAAAPGEVAARASIVVLSLPSVAAFEQVVGGEDGLVSGARPGLAVIEASTLPLPVKEHGRQLLADRGAVMLDCPVSGTGAQIRGKDVVIYASGDPATLARVRPVLAAFSRAQVDLGAFGNGTRLKLVANLLVAIHNVAAAEALLLAGRAGLDPQQALAALTAGAGTSRMLEVRGPLMVAGEYGEASMRVATFQKDLDIITSFAAGLGCPVPVFAAAAQVHAAALASGHANEDTASVFAVLQQVTGQPGPSPAAPPSVSSGGQPTYDD